MSVIIDYRGKSPVKATSGVPLITAKVVKNGRILPTDEYIAEKDYVSWMRRGIPKQGDIVITTEAPLGEVAQLDERRVALAQRLITLRGKPAILDNTFLKYLLQEDFVQAQLRARATGTTVAGIRQSELRRIGLSLPPLLEQRAIAHVLGAIDDKIDLNRRMAGTLEEMARALFTSWFVRFDPVRAKMAGQPTGLPAHIEALFPDALVDSELGEVPEGWEQHAIGEMASVERGLSYKGEYLSTTDGRPMINLGCFKGNGAFDYSKTKLYAGDYRPRHLLAEGDLVYANTDMTQNRTILGSPHIVSSNGTKTKFLFSHHVSRVVMRPEAQNWTTHIFYSLLQPSFRERAEGFSTGTTVLALPADGLLALEVTFPPSTLRDVFRSIAEEVRVRVSKLNVDIDTLSSLRDTLLPKLVSGEVRITDPEAFLRRAGLDTAA